MKYAIEVKENGELLQFVDTLEESVKIVEQYIKEDGEDNNFYSIYEIENSGKDNEERTLVY